MKHNLEFWLEAENIEQDPQITNTQQEDTPADSELGGGEDMRALDQTTEQPQDQDAAQDQTQDQDVTQDPESPDMPEEVDDSNKDFEVWKANYFKESIKGDPNKMMELISPVRAKDELEPYQRKFIEDNWNIQLLRMNSNVSDASKQIRKSIKEQLDKNNPATSVVNHIVNTLESIPGLKETFIRMMGYSGNKGELHRKFIAALTGSVQVSSSPDKENIIFNEKEYSIKMSTRLNSEWGEVALGSWALREDDPERYLAEPELRRLSEGSPQERDVLRRRVVVESIAKHFEEQAFIINVVDEEGTIYYLGWDIANALRGAYSEGKVVVKTAKSENSEAMISDDGQIVPMIDLRIYFVKEGEGQDDEGNPIMQEIEFMQKRNGMLFLTAGLSTIRDAAQSMQGTEFKEIPYAGNPSDLKVLKRCVYSVHDLLMRQC
jgi:hypothetical protein